MARKKGRRLVLEVADTGSELRVLRAAAGLRIMDVAQRVGAHPNSIAVWEKGIRPLPTGMEARLREVFVAAGVRAHG